MSLHVRALATGVVDVAATDADRNEIAKSFLDTLAVAQAGHDEPVVRALRSRYGERPALPEHRAMLMATAAHALDFDDLQFSSVTHASAVLVPALLAVADDAVAPTRAADLAAGYLAGVNLARWVGTALGPEHYRAGWHATSTIGPLAAAAAVGRYQNLSLEAMTHAIGLASCQASGTQRSFGAMAKPLQAGLAAAAGVRAAELAQLGVSGPREPFGAGGFETLYGSQPQGGEPVDTTTLTLDLARKAYPCCYCGQRLVAASLALRERLGQAGLADIERVTLKAQQGTLIPLQVSDPKEGNEAKFCASYLIAAALLDGRLGLDHFTLDSLARPDIQALRRKVEVIEYGPQADSIEGGFVQASARLRGARTLQGAEIWYFPGSTQTPLTVQQLEDKLFDCLGGTQEAVVRLKQKVRHWLGVSLFQ